MQRLRQEQPLQESAGGQQAVRNAGARRHDSEPLQPESTFGKERLGELPLTVMAAQQELPRGAVALLLVSLVTEDG